MLIGLASFEKSKCLWKGLQNVKLILVCCPLHVKHAFINTRIQCVLMMLVCISSINTIDDLQFVFIITAFFHWRIVVPHVSTMSNAFIYFFFRARLLWLAQIVKVRIISQIKCLKCFVWSSIDSIVVFCAPFTLLACDSNNYFSSAVNLFFFVTRKWQIRTVLRSIQICPMSKIAQQDLILNHQPAFMSFNLDQQFHLHIRMQNSMENVYEKQLLERQLIIIPQ